MGYSYDFDRERCWYKNSCSLYKDDEHCNAGCVRFMEMDYLMWASNIPKKQQKPATLTPSKKDKDAFLDLNDIKEDVVHFVENGENLYIFGEGFGTGKTTWAIKIMLKYFDEVWAGNGFKCRGILVHVPTFLTKIKEGIGMKDDEFNNMRAKLLEVDLVIWDDIAATKLTDFDHTNLLTYIDQRNLQGLSNIYTGNLVEDEMREALGNRLKSRVWNASQQVEIKDRIDRRGVDA